MKSRQGFVSNSSSSSFIVFFPEQVYSQAGLQRTLFGDADLYSGPYHGEHPTKYIVEILYQQLEYESASKEKIMQALSEFSFPSNRLKGWTKPPKYPRHTASYTDTAAEAEYTKVCKKFEKEYKTWEKRVAKDLMSQHKGSFMQIFEIEDHSQIGADMESGELFAKLPHVKCSNH